MRRRLGTLAALLCGLALWGGCVLYQDLSQVSGRKDWLRVVSNGALLPGVLFVGLSAMSWIAGEGLFDGIRYSLSTMLVHLKGGEKKYASYYDYVQREKKRPGYPMLLPGLFFLAAAAALTLLYYVL